MSEVEACRTCGIFFLFSSNYLRHLFSSEPEMVHVRNLLETWNVKLDENDRFPQYICTVCLLEFCKIIKFKHDCLKTQEQLRQLYTIQQENIQKMHIKSEPCDNVVVKKEPECKTIGDDESNVCTFIYVDDLSDSEYDNEVTNIPQFKVPHIPVKEEIIEEAHVPIEATSEHHNAVAKTEQTSSHASIPQSPDHQKAAIVSESSMDENGVQCDFCLHISADQQEHRQHLLRIHERKPLECHVCGKQFKAGTTQTRFKYHLKWHRLNKHIKCPQCGFHCASRDILNEHTRAVHTKAACKICGKRFLPKKMRLHMEEHQLQDKAVLPKTNCPYCFINFNNELERDQHIINTHSREATPNTSATSNLESLTSSYINMEETTQESITESGSETETSSTATATTTMSYSPDDRSANIAHSYNSGNEECNDLDQNTDHVDPYETTLENEMSTVNLTAHDLVDMQFNCAQCPESFAKVEQLIAHAEIHQEKALFCCDVCGKKFDLKFSLNRHMKRHKNMTF